jgi:FkbM family methyltransferase
MQPSSIIKRVFHLLGYDVRRRSNQYRLLGDGHFAQKQLTAGAAVELIVDIGANRGQAAQRYAADYPSARIHSFEPFGPAFSDLQRLAKRVGQITPVNVALADSPGKIALNINRDDRTNSILPVAHDVDSSLAIDPRGTCEVTVDTLDAYCERVGITRIDILKADVQGAEVKVFRGAERLLATRSVRLVFTEVLFAPVYAGQGYFLDVLSYLSGHRYDLFGLYNTHFLNGRPAWADAIFLPR